MQRFSWIGATVVLSCLTILASALDARPQAGYSSDSGEPQQPVEDFGPLMPAPVAVAFVTLAASDFAPVAGTAASFDGRNYCTSGFCAFDAGVPVPHASTIVAIEIAACDVDHTSGTIGFSLGKVHPEVPSGVQSVSDPVTVPQTGCGFLWETITPPHVVDQFFFTYVVRVTITSTDLDEGFAAVRVFYRPGSGAVVPTGTVSVLP